MKKFKVIKMTPREKALLAIIIAEIEGCQDLHSVAAITNSWVTANDLHPENVNTLETIGPCPEAEKATRNETTTLMPSF